MVWSAREPGRGDPYVARAQNVILTKPGETSPDQIVILCAHYDSHGGPGADDNASGVAACLEAARVLSHGRFARTIQIIFFTAEELSPGLLGSRLYVSQLSAQVKDNIVAVINLDTIAGNNLRVSRTKGPNASQTEDLNIGYCGPRTPFVDHIVGTVRRSVPGFAVMDSFEALSRRTSSDHESFVEDKDIHAAILDCGEKSAKEFEKDLSGLHNRSDNARRIDWGVDGFFYKAARAAVAAVAAAAEPVTDRPGAAQRAADGGAAEPEGSQP